MLKALNRAVKTIALFALVSFCLLGSAGAQVTTSTVTGRVVDGQGNVVPGAKITVTSRATGSERIAVTRRRIHNPGNTPWPVQYFSRGPIVQPFAY